MMIRRDGVSKRCMAGDHWTPTNGGCGGWCHNARSPKTSECKCPCHEAQKVAQRKFQEEQLKLRSEGKEKEWNYRS